MNTAKPDQLRRSAEQRAIASSCCGFTGEVTLTDSAIIILFAGMLGAGDMLSMISTSVLVLFNGLMLIPMVYLVTRLGARRLITISCAVASGAYFLAAAAPWFGQYAVHMLLGMILLFALVLTGFIAGWFPLLDSFLAAERRTAFFGKMRFCHQLSAVVFLLAAGCVIGRKPSLQMLQGVLFCGAVIFCGRGIWIGTIPRFPQESGQQYTWFSGLATAASNHRLTGFSLYQFMLNLAVFGLTPLTMLALKNSFKAPDNVIVFISGAALSGMLLGYLCAAKIIDCCGRRWIFPILHVLYLPAPLCLVFIDGSNAANYVLIGSLLALSSFVIAVGSIMSSAEMLRLSTPGNKTMAMAFCGAFYYGGGGVARLLTSLLLGSGILTEGWHCAGHMFSRYQSIFLLYSAATLFAGVFLIAVPAVREARHDKKRIADPPRAAMR